MLESPEDSSTENSNADLDLESQRKRFFSVCNIYIMVLRVNVQGSAPVNSLDCRFQFIS